MAENPSKKDATSGVDKPKVQHLNRRQSEQKEPPPKGVKDEIRAVLIGRTGEGKSATANTIFGRKVFASAARGQSVTANCDYHTEKIKDRLLCMIDTPGLFDTEITNDEIKKGILDYLAMTSPGPHVFLVVIKVGRYTEEQAKTYEAVCELFGNEIHKFSIVVLTGGDDLKYDGKTVEDYLEESPAGLTEIIEKSNKRYVLFNNRATGPEKENQVECLLKTMDKLIKTNKNCFSSGTYISVEKVLQELENRKAIIKKKEEEAKALTDELKSKKDELRSKKDELWSQKAKIDSYETRVRAFSNERRTIQSHRESQFIDMEREYEAKLRNLEDKYEKQLREAREQIRIDIQTKKIDTSDLLKEQIKGDLEVGLK